ncbi:hypothetical protein [Rappaport israeli]|uniref:hypothetical protein n=1 Tax=Rappaport israeli TaxID=1839807 RepID=UPI00093105AD|nr:hypothetical protein [Rappaport israeli]
MMHRLNAFSAVSGGLIYLLNKNIELLFCIELYKVLRFASKQQNEEQIFVKQNHINQKDIT